MKVDAEGSEESAQRIKPCIVTLVGVIDIIGELLLPENPTPGHVIEESFARILHPYFLRGEQYPPSRPGANDGKVSYKTFPMLKGSPIMRGDAVLVNVKNILWIVEPSPSILDDYQCQRSSIVRASSIMRPAVNQ